MTHTFKCELFITMLDYLRLYVQHNERGSAGQGGRRYDRQASGELLSVWALIFIFYAC
jgi:hypothetical protein